MPQRYIEHRVRILPALEGAYETLLRRITERDPQTWGGRSVADLIEHCARLGAAMLDRSLRPPEPMPPMTWGTRMRAAWRVVRTGR